MRASVAPASPITISVVGTRHYALLHNRGVGIPATRGRRAGGTANQRMHRGPMGSHSASSKLLEYWHAPASVSVVSTV